MAHRKTSAVVPVFFVVGVVGLVAAFAAVAAFPPPRRRALILAYDDRDVEAAARMLASENPHGSQALHIEQVWSQLNARQLGESLFDRITAGSGFGSQGKRVLPGGKRPVATDDPARPQDRVLVREILEGNHPAKLRSARAFFEPKQQDAAYQIGERARQKRRLATGLTESEIKSRGLALTKQEARLLGYEKDANQIRKSWGRLIGAIDGVEFYG